MRINLLCKDDLRQDFINIDHRINEIKPIEGCKVVAGYFNNLTPLIADDSCDDIMISELLNTLAPNTILECLSHWRTKLKTGGKIYFTFIDVYQQADSCEKIINSERFFKLFQGSGRYISVLGYNSLVEILNHIKLSFQVSDGLVVATK